MVGPEAPARGGLNGRAGADGPKVAAGRWVGLGVLLLGSFMAVVDGFIVTVALPSVRADLGASFGQTQAVVAGYGMTYAVALITGGRLGDLYGHRRVVLAGMAAFTAASAACGAATGPAVPLAARLAQGVAAAVAYSRALTWTVALLAGLTAAGLPLLRPLRGSARDL